VRANGFLLPAFVLLSAVPASAQTATVCDQPVRPPPRLPPAGSGPVVYYLALCFSAQGNVSMIEPETYLYYIQLRPSRPSEGEWVAFDDRAEETIRADFRRLWATNFLEDLKIEATDYPFSNGVIGKLITFHLEERARIKLVNYEGSTALDRTTIDERLRERGIALRLDSFLDEGAVTRARGVIREMMAEKGFANADVRHVVTPIGDSSKQVSLTFTIHNGPKLAIRDIEFLGNRAVADSTLASAMKENRAQSLLSLLSGGGTYRDAKFADNAQNVEDYYRDHGYVNARVGEPELRALDDSEDGSTRWIQLRIPVDEGGRYRVGEIAFDGNQLVPGDALRRLIKLSKGDWYSQKAIRDGLIKARQLYGASGYMEFTGFPELGPQDADGTVDVTIRVTEGAQYFVNRITFTGNTVTRDHVIRRELRVVEGGVFNTEALKLSIRRLNQLGYFKPLEGGDKDVKVEKAAGKPNAVDVTLAFEEQNRNQIQFGGGMSQYEGVFGSLSFTTANFLGRGESLTLSGQKGVRSSVYQVAFTEPYLFDRPLTAGVDFYSRKIDYLTGVGVVGYSEVREGVNLTVGRPLFQFSRGFLTYGYEVIHTAVSDDIIDDLDDQASIGVPLFNPFLDEGRHVESRLTWSFIHNTVDQPIMPRSGRRLTLTSTVAGGALGGTTNYLKPEIEAVQYIPLTSRTALGLRANAGWLRAFGRTATLPYYVRYFLGGEYQIRGVDIRTVGPTDANNRALGGNRFVLFNAEYYVDLFGPVRLLAFHDAGQAFSESQRIDLRQLRTSSGVEVRVMVPMLNVPFRLIYAWNIYRDTFQPARGFKFAVGTTF
jgi:outer membrane protein insertion porin family